MTKNPTYTPEEIEKAYKWSELGQEVCECGGARRVSPMARVLLTAYRESSSDRDFNEEASAINFDRAEKAESRLAAVEAERDRLKIEVSSVRKAWQEIFQEDLDAGNIEAIQYIRKIMALKSILAKVEAEKLSLQVQVEWNKRGRIGNMEAAEHLSDMLARASDLINKKDEALGSLKTILEGIRFGESLYWPEWAEKVLSLRLEDKP